MPQLRLFGRLRKRVEERMKEREISLWELLIEMMLQWRIILVWMVAGAAMAGAFSYVWSNHASGNPGTGEQAQTAGKNLIQDPSVLEDQLTDMQLQNVNYVVDYESVYRDKLAYQEKSLLMQINANCVQRTDLTFYVDAENWRSAVSIEKAYEDLIQGGELSVYAAGQVHGESAASISEAVSLARGSGGLAEGTSSFRVNIIHYDKSVMRDIAKIIVRFLEEKHGQIEEVMGKHEIITANQSEAEVADMGILERQINTIEDIASMETKILQYKNAFTAEEQQYYDVMVKESGGSDAANIKEEQQDSAESGDKDSSGISIRYVVLGMFLAAFIYLFVFFMRYVFNHKLCVSDSLQELYDIPQLGLIPQQQESRKPFDFIDRWILSLRDSGGRRFTKDEALRLSAAAVKMAAAKEGTGKICLVGCSLSGQALEVCETIRGDLAKEGIRAEILNNVLYDAQAMCSLEGVGAAVLVERAQFTFYSEIARETELLRRQGIMVLGGIITA